MVPGPDEIKSVEKSKSTGILKKIARLPGIREVVAGAGLMAVLGGSPEAKAGDQPDVPPALAELEKQRIQTEQKIEAGGVGYKFYKEDKIDKNLLKVEKAAEPPIVIEEESKNVPIKEAQEVVPEPTPAEDENLTPAEKRKADIDKLITLNVKPEMPVEKK